MCGFTQIPWAEISAKVCYVMFKETWDDLWFLHLILLWAYNVILEERIDQIMHQNQKNSWFLKNSTEISFKNTLSCRAARIFLFEIKLLQNEFHVRRFKSFFWRFYEEFLHFRNLRRSGTSASEMLQILPWEMIPRCATTTPPMYHFKTKAL